MKYNLLIVEDHELTRYGLTTTFENTDFVENIYEAANAEDGIEIVKMNSVHACIMDLGLPGINGIEAIKIIKEINPDIKFIVLTSHEDDEEVVAALQSGSHSYCRKNIKPKKLVEAVQSTLEGVSWFDSKVSDVVLDLVNANVKNIANNKQEISVKDYKLTGREKQVLKLMTDGATNQDIAKQLYISINTTKAHVCSILQKLEVDDRTQAVIKALRDRII